MKRISLRYPLESDLEIFFRHQLDEEANYMAAFTAKDPTDKEAFLEKWKKILSRDATAVQTILLDEDVAGSIGSYDLSGELQVTYWIGREYWGQGITTRALQAFLKMVNRRPVFGRVAFDNIGSRKVLEACGFEVVDTGKWFANARGCEIEEIVFRLDE